MIYFRRFDLGQQLALLNMGSDIEVPALEVSIGPGIDRRVDKGLNVARQKDLLGRRARFGLNDQNGRRRQLIVSAARALLALKRGMIPAATNDDNQQDGQQDHCAANPRPLAGSPFRSRRRIAASRAGA